MSGNNTYTTSQGNHAGGYVPTTAGTYQWVVVYSGDPNNKPATSGFGSEPQTVSAMQSSISGTKYLDQTGDGFSSDDVGLGGVTIKLYTNASLTGTPYAKTTTAADGSYSFNNLPAGTYYVQESVPTGYVQTGGGPNGSAGATYYTVVVQSGQVYGGNDFDDFLIPTCQPKSYCFTVTNNCTSTTVSDLGGHTDQGDTVTVTFSTGAMSDQLTLVSYIAPGSSFDSTTAYQQQIFDVASGTFAANGTYSLTVLIPNCYYQIDFICGPAIGELGNPNAGPDGGNIFYSTQSRLLSADNDGTKAFSTKAVASGDFGTTALWTTSNGQNLINKLNGSSSSTQLVQSLAMTFPNLYGSGAGSHSLVNANGSYFKNSQVASAYSSFSGGDQQVLSAALSVYATSVEFAGSSAAAYAKTPVGLTTSLYGSGMDTYNVGANGESVRRGQQHDADRDAAPRGSQRQDQPRGGREFGRQRGLQWDQHDRKCEKRRPEQQRAGLYAGPAPHGLRRQQPLAGRHGPDHRNRGRLRQPEHLRNTRHVRRPVRHDHGRRQPLRPIRPVVVVPDRARSGRLNDQPARRGPDWRRRRQLGAGRGARRGVGACHGSGRPDHSGRGEQSVAQRPDQSRGHGGEPAGRLGGVDELGLHRRPDGAGPGRGAVRPGPDHAGRPPGRHLRGQHGRLRHGSPRYPAFSPNVVAVGGTSLQLGSASSYQSETGWGYNSDAAGVLIGGGGGASQYEAEPTYQLGVQSTGYRTTPDVSFVADPATGVVVADTYNLSADNPWLVVGGTSLSAPSWAGLIALANQGRAAAGESTLGSASDPTSTQERSTASRPAITTA